MSTLVELIQCTLVICSDVLHFVALGVRLSSLENRKTCKQGTLKELFQRQVSAESPRKLQADIEHATSTTQTDMATCPVCNQLVPAENTVFNQHIDECLNCSAIKETLSDNSISTHQSNRDDSSSGSSSQVLSPFKLHVHDSDSHCCQAQESLCASSSPSTLAYSRKRKATLSTTHKPAKRLTLDHYFNSPSKQNN